jgi:hypothetical protein
MKKKHLTVLVAKFSGNWNNSANTGSFYLNLNNTSSNRNANISAHLVNMRKIVEVCCTLPLGKTKIQNTVLVSP